MVHKFSPLTVLRYCLHFVFGICAEVDRVGIGETCFSDFSRFGNGRGTSVRVGVAGSGGLFYGGVRGQVSVVFRPGVAGS